jgi:hypothetical protein
MTRLRILPERRHRPHLAVGMLKDGSFKVPGKLGRVDVGAALCLRSSLKRPQKNLPREKPPEREEGRGDARGEMQPGEMQPGETQPD